jgi:hypothetical protein
MQAMQLELTTRWTGERLEQLASALQLPCPVRESFLFDADHAFRVSCTETDITLQRAIKRVFQHAGLPCDAAVVLWKRSLGTTVERDGHSWFFEVPTSMRGDAIALGTMIAQEAGRALLAQRVVTSGGDHDLELAAILAGLGALLVAAPSPRQALPQPKLRFAFARTAASLGLGLRRTLDVVPEKLPYILWWLRVSRRPLPFAKLEPHVVIRCFCAKRLRVPTGAVGATTCPACKRKRPFDGRPCRVAVV